MNEEITKEDLACILEMQLCQRELFEDIASERHWDLHEYADFLLSVWKSKTIINAWWNGDCNYWTECFNDTDLIKKAIREVTMISLSEYLQDSFKFLSSIEAEQFAILFRGVNKDDIRCFRNETEYFHWKYSDGADRADLINAMIEGNSTGRSAREYLLDGATLFYATTGAVGVILD